MKTRNRKKRSAAYRVSKSALLAVALSNPAYALVWTGNHPASPNWDAAIPMPIRYANWQGLPTTVPGGPGLLVEFGNGQTGGGFGSGVPTLKGSRTASSIDINHTGDQTLFATTTDILTLVAGDITRDSGSTGIHTIGSGIALGNTGEWDIAGSGRLTVDNTISGGFSLTKTGAGTLRFEKSTGNTYTGQTTVSEGKLTLAKPTGTVAVPTDLIIDGTGFVQHPNGNGEQIADTATVTVNAAGAIYDLNQPANTETVATFNANTGTTRLGGGTLNTTAVGFAGDPPGLPGSPGNCTVTVVDLSLLALNFGFSAALGTDPIGLSLTDAAALAGIDPSAVPEPATLTIITMTAVMSRRRRTR